MKRRAAEANADWSSITRASCAKSAPARASTHGRHRSTILRALAGGGVPEIASRASRPITSTNGADLAIRNARIALRAAALFQRRRQILRHARHAPRAQSFAARLLDDIEDRARHLAARLHLVVHGVVMVAEAQRDRIRLAAHHRHFIGRQIARGQRQPRFGAAHRRPFRRETHRQLRLMRDGAHGRGRQLPEILDRSVVRFRHGIRAALLSPAAPWRPDR